MIERRDEIAIVEANQQLTSLHMLVVADQDLRDETRDMRRHRGDVAAGIGVVGGLDETPDIPPMMPVSRRSDRND